MSNCNCDVCRVLNCQCEALKIFEGLYGPYFTPAIDENGNLSWTNNAGLPNPPTLNIMGTPGTGLEISGVVASAGDLPGSAEDWECYLVGTAAPYTIYTYNPDSGWMSLGQLATGPKGDTGPYYLPIVSSSGVITWTNNGGLPNPEGVNIKGPPGQDGVSPAVTVEDIPGGHRVTITDAEHPDGQSFDVMDGTGGGGGGGGGSPYDSNPAALGTASPGSSNDYARGDHVHPKPSPADLGAAPAPVTGQAYDSSAANYLQPYQVYNAVIAGKALCVKYSAQDIGNFWFTDFQNLFGSITVATVVRDADGALMAYQLIGTTAGAWTLTAVQIAKESELAALLPKTGGTMSGAIAMGSNKITGLANAENDGDAVNLGQVAGMISTNTAFFRGSFASKAALLAVAWQTSNPSASYYVTNNDFAIVQDDETQSDECWRYVYVSGTGWEAQYRINETPLTTAQLAALNSGATAENISAIADKQAKIAASGMLKGDGNGGVSAALAGTDYQAPLVAGTDYATPAQIAPPPKTTLLSIATTDWSSQSCTKAVTGMTTTAVVWIEYSDTTTVFTCVQSTDALTFTCDAVPSAAVTVKVAFMEGVALT